MAGSVRGVGLPLAPVAVAVAATAEVVGLARSRPFTLASELLVSAALGAAVAVVVAQRLATTVPAGLGRRTPPAGVRALGVRWLWLVVPVVAVVVWEVAAYVGVPRVDHPTLSSLLDAVDRTAAGRGATAIAWLALGRELVTR